MSLVSASFANLARLPAAAHDEVIHFVRAQR
jgi:hypothetical protein